MEEREGRFDPKGDKEQPGRRFIPTDDLEGNGLELPSVYENPDEEEQARALKGFVEAWRGETRLAGAFVYGSENLRQHLINRARSFVFSTAMLPAQAAAGREALRIARAEPVLRDRLATNAQVLRQLLEGSGILPQIDAPGTHIIPIRIGAAAEAVRVGGELRDAGFLVGAVRPPTVAEGTSRLRISVSAVHTPAQISGLAKALSNSLSTPR